MRVLGRPPTNPPHAAPLTTTFDTTEHQMKLKIHLCIVSAVAALLFGCGMASDVMETQKKSDAIASALEKEIGVKPHTAWELQNGTLAHINVQFPVDGVANLPIGELVSKVRTAVTTSFDKPPQQLVVSTFSQP